MPVIDRLVPYGEQLLENQDVQESLQRAATRARQAYGGARSKKSTKQALRDHRVRRRFTQSVVAARDAAFAVQRGRDEQERKLRRRRQRGRVLVLAAVAGTALVASNEDVRERVLEVLGGAAESARNAVASAADQPVPAGTEST